LDQKTLKLLLEVEWSTIHRTLLAHTRLRARRYRWNGGGYLDLAAGYTVEDVVQEVIVKTLDGTRRWDPERGQLLPWLESQARSIMDALVRSASHRYEMHVLEVESFACEPSPDLAEREAEMQNRERVQALFQTVEREPELSEILQVILDGCEPRPRYIALELGISVREVDNRLKRLRRRAMRVVEREVLQSQ
jgi:RNA polymerase sigma factor (sigma-70 family)